jgi:hypothetical protein
MEGGDDPWAGRNKGQVEGVGRSGDGREGEPYYIVHAFGIAPDESCRILKNPENKTPAFPRLSDSRLAHVKSRYNTTKVPETINGRSRS